MEAKEGYLRALSIVNYVRGRNASDQSEIDRNKVWRSGVRILHAQSSWWLSGIITKKTIAYAWYGICVYIMCVYIPLCVVHIW